MKILVVGDPHLTHSHLTRSIDLLKWIEQVADENAVDAVVNLGDTFNTHAVIRSEIMAEFTKHTNRMVANDRPYYVLVGNHDFFKPNDPAYHALMVFKNTNKNLIIIDTPTDYGDMTFVPFISKGMSWPKETKSLVFCHETFQGSSYANGTLADSYMDGNKISSDLIISGHVHTRQTVSDRIIYPGTPLATSASDVDQVKGLMIFDTETFKYHYIESPFPMWHKHSINLNDSPDLSLPGYIEQDHHVIIITGTKAEIKAALCDKVFVEARKRLSTHIKIEATDSKKIDQVSIKASSPTDMMLQYVDSVYKGNMDREELKKLATSYMGN